MATGYVLELELYIHLAKKQIWELLIFGVRGVGSSKHPAAKEYHNKMGNSELFKSCIMVSIWFCVVSEHRIKIREKQQPPQHHYLMGKLMY